MTAANFRVALQAPQPVPAATGGAPHRLPVLDGVRGLAALAVCLVRWRAGV